MEKRLTAILPALRLHVGGQLVWLAEKASASAMLGPLALVVSHGARLSPRRVFCRDLHVEEPAHIETTSPRVMLGKGEREASGEEIATLEAEHGAFQAADGEG
jgi:hypothetical protein